jgi:lipopolysaccharide/colanic/teichoic acid biosynthesis glycosyltransferase
MLSKDTVRHHSRIASHQQRSVRQVRLPILAASWYPPFKTAVEFVAALFMLIIAGPIILLSALIVRLTSPGPAFYSQTRLGRNGRAYTIYKLRSMRHDCERDSGALWSPAGDPRVTPVGRFLRRTHLDELPQLWNVLCGDMSLVGPRPERPEFIPELESKLPFYGARLSVRPGVSGLAQVQLQADTDLESVRRKLAYDLHYVQYCGPWLDCRIVLATALHMLAVPYHHLGKVLFLPHGPRIENAYERLASGETAEATMMAAEDAPVVQSLQEVGSPCIAGVEG